MNTSVLIQIPKRINKVVLGFILVITLTSLAVSQPLITGRSAGLAGSGATVSFGLHCEGWNPANLGLKANPAFFLNLPGIGLSFGNNSMSPKFIGETFVEDTRLTPEQIADILAQLKTETLDINTTLGVPVIGFAQSRFAFGLNLYLNSHLALPKDMFELMFNGPVKNHISRFDNIQSESASWWAASFSLGQPLPHPGWFREFSAGATLRYLGGLAMQRLEDQSGQALLTNETIFIDGYGKTYESRRGNGWAMDLGFAGVWDRPNLKFGLTLGNFLGMLNWKGVTVREAQFYRDSGLNPDSLARPEYWDWDYFFGKSDTTYGVSSYRTDLPSYLILSISRPFIKNRVEIFGSYTKGRDKAFGQSLKSQFALGSEFRFIPFLPLRCGIAWGGQEEWILAGGWGLSLPGYKLDIGASWQRGILDKAKGFSIAASNYISIP